MSLINVKQCKIQRKWKLDLAQVNALETAISTRCLGTNIPGVKYLLQLFNSSTIQQICFGLLILIPDDTTINAGYEFKVNGICQYQTTEVLFLDNKRQSVRLGTLNDFVRPENNNFPDGYVTFECIATIRSENTVKKTVYGDQLVRYLSFDGFFKNFDIEPMNGARIRFDKCVLSMRSSKFESIFKKQARIGRMKVKYSYGCVTEVFQFCYGQDMEKGIMKLEEKTTKEFVDFSAEYEMPDFYNAVIDVLIKNVNVGNVSKIARISYNSELLRLREFCLGYLMNFAGKKESIADFDMIPEAMIIQVAKRLMTCTLV